MKRLKKGKGWFLFLILSCFLCGCGDNAETGVPVDGPLWSMGMEEPADAVLPTEDSDEPHQEETGNAFQEEDVLTETPVLPEDDGTVTVLISAAGDVTLGNHQEQEYASSFRQMYDREGEAYFFKNVNHFFGKDDLTIVNFEGVLTLSEEMQPKDYNMKGEPSYIGILTQGSVEAVSFGNNHRLDYLVQGSNDTVDAFEEAGIAYAYDNITGMYETKGIRIGFVSVNEASQGAAVEKYLEEGIKKLRTEEDADLVIACCHWGTEKDNYPEEYQQTLGRKCIDWGADLVLGSHPHVLQGIEVYEGKFIVYSLANFCFGGNRNPADKDTMIFQQTFTFREGVKQEDMAVRVIPCSVSSVENKNDFCPTPSEGEEFERILGRINAYSAQYGVSFDEKGYYLVQ